MKLTRKERLVRQMQGEAVDRLPLIGGWINGAENLAAIAGWTTESYLADPWAGMVRANEVLGVDGIISPIVPTQLGEVRSGHVEDASFFDVEPEALLESVLVIPDQDSSILAAFDPSAEEARYRSYYARARATFGEMEPIPNHWELGGHFPLYTEYGYQAFLSACALYPEAVGRIWHAKSLLSRERARIVAKLIREMDLVPMLFCGEDLCDNHGPLVSPAFLREFYFPTVRMIIEPLLEAGITLIHHCDGDVRPLLEDYVAMGFRGLQGFQYECGVDLFEVRRKWPELLLWTGYSVSHTLPFGSQRDVKNELDYFLDATDGGRGMFIHTSNVIGVEVDAWQVKAAYRMAAEAPLRAPGRFRAWPNDALTLG